MGNDAINVAYAGGNNILDGGTESNFPHLLPRDAPSLATSSQTAEPETGNLVVAGGTGNVVDRLSDNTSRPSIFVVHNPTGSTSVGFDVTNPPFLVQT
jgi:hypothetical protein